MLPAPIVIALPIADRPRSHSFYTEGLGLEAAGEPAEDGVPEPLQIVLNEGVRLMLVPTGGFGWIVSDREVASGAVSECLVSVSVPSEAEVDAFVDRARAAGAVVVSEPQSKAWGYVGTFADPDDHLWQVITGAGLD